MLIDFINIYQKYNMNVKGVIHVGAHHGEEIGDYINKNIKNLVFFEPLSESLDILEENLSYHADKANIQIFPYALGNEEKEVEMYVSNHNGMCSSVLKPKVVLEQYPNITFNDREIVKMIRLDDAEIKVEDFNLMNIDVQGYELEVLKGSEKTLNYIDYVYTEINRAEVYENTPHVEELDKYLSTYGFKRVETDWSGDTWGDGFYIKENINV
mgnify:CR=1 FL=1